MRKLSVWASSHPWMTRCLIFLLYIPLNVLGIITGDLLYDFGWVLPGYFLLLLLLIVVLVVFHYPTRKCAIDKNTFYKRRKLLDLTLAVCTFCMVCFTGNQKNAEKPFSLTTSVISVPVAIPAITINEDGIKKKNSFSKPNVTKKETRRKARAFLKQVRKKYKDLSDGEKILLIFLSVLVAVALVVLLAGLACSIACAGSEALAYVVFFLGTGAVVFFLVKIIQKIVRKSRTKQSEKKPVPTNPGS